MPSAEIRGYFLRYCVGLPLLVNLLAQSQACTNDKDLLQLDLFPGHHSHFATKHHSLAHGSRYRPVSTCHYGLQSSRVRCAVRVEQPCTRLEHQPTPLRTAQLQHCSCELIPSMSILRLLIHSRIFSTAFMQISRFSPAWTR